MFPRIFGKYILEGEIAAGGMARVYLATLRGAVGFEKRLVVKQIRAELASDEAFVTRFVEEAKTAVDLSHPNIVPVYELGVEDGVYYIAMEFCAGLTLAELLREGPLDAEEGAYVGIEICRALDYAHRRRGIVHRDVTPRNVMLDEEGAVRLIDFGIAAPVTQQGKRSDLYGSPGHMAPEQLRGGALTAATDVFAVAVLLIEAWTGKAPFRRSTPEASLKALEEPTPELDAPELSPIAPLIAQAIARDADERPKDAEKLARPLRDFLRNADLGDVARRLGARVRSVRQAADESPAPPPQRTDDVETRPLEGESSVTQTFAASEALTEWTRRLPSTAPPANDEAEDAPERESSPSDVPEPTTSSQRRPASGGLRLALLLVAVAAAAGIFGVRFGSRSPPETPEPSATAPATASTPVLPATTAAPVPTPAPLEPSATTEPQRPTVTPSASPKAPASASGVPSASTATVGNARLTLTANPSAQVVVDGRARGGTPITLELGAGGHSIVFRYDALGESLPAHVTLKAGQARSAHADFTAPKPNVSVR